MISHYLNVGLAGYTGISQSEVAFLYNTGDGIAEKWLEKALKICERRNIDILLYTHLSFWLERHEDAVRLCRRLNHPHLGIVFCGYHWYAVDGTNLTGILKEAAPYLKQANLSGSRRNPHGFGNVATIEPLDEGELDNFALLGQLKKIGFQGMFGFRSEHSVTWSGVSRRIRTGRNCSCFRNRRLSPALLYGAHHRPPNVPQEGLQSSFQFDVDKLIRSIGYGTD
jgi:sugar phosphate isomerase/epimerase